jgi:F0F1-type ATP synthase membrane subunit b/b'
MARKVKSMADRIAQLKLKRDAAETTARKADERAAKLNAQLEQLTASAREAVAAADR